jgi:hypothetical protein
LLSRVKSEAPERTAFNLVVQAAAPADLAATSHSSL